MKKPLGKAARFAFISAPASIFGWNMNRMLFATIQRGWREAVNPACPACDRSALVINADIQPESAEPEYGAEANGAFGSRARPQLLYAWQCAKCGFALLAPRNVVEVRSQVTALRNERVRASLSTIEVEERAAIAQGHQRAARTFYAASAVIFCGFLYMVASNVPVLSAASWCTFSFMFGTLGLKKAYRSWQVTHGHLFQQGAFWFWLRHETWLV